MDRHRRLSVNRGVELNDRRRKGDEVDIVFRIGDEEFPAHKLIVGLRSPFLKALVSGPPGFRESGPFIDLSSEISSTAFASLLDYIYSGEISLSPDNVFEIIETATFLQINNDPLLDFATEFLLDMIPSVEEIEVFVQIWNVSERFNLSSLSSKLYKVLEYKLESFLDQDLLSYVGLEELSRLFSNPALCVRDEQRLLDSLLPLITDEEDKDILERFYEILAQYFSFKLISWESHDGFSDSLLQRFKREVDLQREKFPLRNCRNCVYLFEYTKGANAITNIETFLEDKKFGPSFAYLSINKDSPSLSFLSSLTNGKSYHQYYGPHSQVNYSIISTPSSLLLLGGLSTHLSSKTVKSSSLTSDLKTFEYSSGTWLRWRSSIPYPCVGFGAVYLDGKIYIFGGLTESVTVRGVRYLNSKLAISKKVYVAHEKDLTQMTNSCWRQLSEIPFERTDFSTIQAQNTIYLIGHGFIDVYDLPSDSWSSLPPINTFSKPAVALIGSSIYILSGKCPNGSEGSNHFYSLHTLTHTLTPLPRLPELRFDVIDAFAHNNRFYVFVKQRSVQTALFVFDPEKSSWTQVLSNIPGTLRPGVLLRTPWLSKTFFSNSKAIQLESR